MRRSSPSNEDSVPTPPQSTAELEAEPDSNDHSLKAGLKRAALKNAALKKSSVNKQGEDLVLSQPQQPMEVDGPESNPASDLGPASGESQPTQIFDSQLSELDPEAPVSIEPEPPSESKQPTAAAVPNSDPDGAGSTEPEQSAEVGEPSQPSPGEEASISRPVENRLLILITSFGGNAAQSVNQSLALPAKFDSVLGCNVPYPRSPDRNGIVCFEKGNPSPLDDFVYARSYC